MMFARKTSMIQTLLLVVRLTLFVDQCDAGACHVFVGASVNPVTMPQSALPACAHEGSSLFAGNCIETEDQPSEAPRMDLGADINL